MIYFQPNALQFSYGRCQRFFFDETAIASEFRVYSSIYVVAKIFKEMIASCIKALCIETKLDFDLFKEFVYR